MMNIMKDTLANTIGTFANCIAIWLMSVLTVRLVDYECAGEFALALSSANIFVSIGSFSMRFYYSSDIKKRFSDIQYITSRFFTIYISIVLCLITTLFMKYERGLVIVILLFYLYKCTEQMADIFYGTMQRYGKLYLSGYSMVIRSVGSLLIFIAILETRENLIEAIIGMIVFSLLLLCFYDVRVSRGLANLHFKTTHVDRREAWHIIGICLPLFVITLCYNAIPSIPRIIFERMYTGRELGFYASISNITVVVSMAVNCIGIPIIPKLTAAFLKKEKQKLVKIVLLLLSIVCVTGILAVLCAALFGEQVLVLLFGEEIKPYSYLLWGMILASTMTAMISCLNNFFIAAQKTKQLMISSLSGVVVCLATAIPLCRYFYMQGLIYCLLLSQGIECLIILVFLRKILNLLDEESGGQNYVHE